MARTKARLPEGTRLTDFVSLGVLASVFPLQKVMRILDATGKASIRQRCLPAHVTVYYTIAMALYMQVSCREVLRCLFEGLRWLFGEEVQLNIAGRAGISQARTRLGSEPVQQLHDEIVKPIAVRSQQKRTQGAWYRDWRLVSLDGSTLDVADTEENAATYGRHKASGGKSAFPQIRFVSLVENGTHVLFGSRMDCSKTDVITLGRQVVSNLGEGMLCLADRSFFGYSLWKQSSKTGADLLWRVKKNIRLPCLRRLPDGSYLSKIYESEKHQRHDDGGIVVRGIEYQLNGVVKAKKRYRLVTTILDFEQAPANELAALYHERREIETALDEFKIHQRGAKIVLRSKRPDLVRQEFYGLMMAHFAIRGLMHEAALKGDVDPDRLSFVHAVRVIQQRMAMSIALPPSAQKGLSPIGT